MRIDVLGPLDAVLNDRSTAPSASKPRQLLALLALHADTVLPVPALMQELWGEELPRSAQTTLQTYILQLRRCLAGALGEDAPLSAKEILATRYGGYLLRMPREAVDAHRYENLVAEGQRAANSREDRRATSLFRSALGLWRGPALADVRTGQLLEIEVIRLEESRLSVLEQTIAVELRLGRHQQLLSELSALTARHPLHEGLHAQWMVALYRSGRSWQALDAFQNLRDRLVAELGLEPTPRLQQLHQDILAAAPALEPALGPHACDVAAVAY